ncbi:MAG: AMP-binding protein, partial [Actinomycetes bacterium]
LAAIAALLAVATVPDTTLLWAPVTALGVAHRRLAPGLYEVDRPVPGETDRPLWGVCTSGTSGAAKVAIGYADQWELIALHYRAAVLDRKGTDNGDGEPPVLATCLPLQFSAAFFMTVLPSLYLRRDLLVFPAEDWSPVISLARERDVFVLSVPALAAAVCLGMPGPVDMRRATLVLGGGHVDVERVRSIRERFVGVSIANIYGTAETGAIALNYEPGHNEHIGHPIPGKAVWLRDVDAQGVGTLATAGPDCCRYTWRPGTDPIPNAGHVAGTDYARFDDAGRLCLEGRIDDGEKLCGVLVYPRSIERHLLALDGVSDARVLVHRGASGLEHLVARVVGSVTQAQVREHCGALPETERPTRVECIPEAAALAAYSANGKL